MDTIYKPQSRHKTIHLFTILSLLLSPLTVMSQSIELGYPIEIQGECRASELQSDCRIKLTGNTTLIVDKDYYVREITASSDLYDLTIKTMRTVNQQYPNGKTYTLTVDQNNKNTPAVKVRNLTITGDGNTVISGRDMGVQLNQNGKLTCSYTKANISSRNDGFAIQGLRGNSVLIESSTVNISSERYAFAGYMTDLYSTPELKSFTVKEGSDVTVNGSIGLLFPTLVSSSNFSLGEFNVEGGTVILNNRQGMTTLYADKVNLTGGKITVNQGGSFSLHDLDSGINAFELNVSNCELNVNTNWHGIIAYSFNIDNAKVNVHAGTKSEAIRVRNNIKILGAQTEVEAVGYTCGISANNIDIQCKKLYASAKNKGSLGLYARNKLNIDLLDANSYYQIASANMNPCHAEGGIFMKKPCDISVNSAEAIYHEGEKEFERTMVIGYGNVLTMMAPQAWKAFSIPVQTEVVYVGDTRKISLGSAKDKITWENPSINFALCRGTTIDDGVPYTRYDGISPTWQQDYTFQSGDAGYTYFGMFSVDPCQSWAYAGWAYEVRKRDNTLAPLAPSLAYRSGSLYIDNPHHTTTEVNGKSVELRQEYLMFTSLQDASKFTEADWANAKTPEQFSSAYKMASVSSGQHLYVYTRYKANDYFNAGKVVAYKSISTGSVGTEMTGIQLEAAGVNNKIQFDQNGPLLAYIVPKNTIVRVREYPEPVNASDFVGTSGAFWVLAQDGIKTLYEDESLTREIVKDDSHFYKEVYFKAENVTTKWNDTYRVSVTDKDYTTVYFVVTEDETTVPLLDIISPTMIYVKAGEIKEVPLDIFPASTTQELSVSQLSSMNVTGNDQGPSPQFTFNTEKKSVTIDCTQVRPGYAARVMCNSVAPFYVYVVASEQDGLDVTPRQAMIDPADGSIQLTASVTPSTAGTVEWNFSGGDGHLVSPVFTPSSATGISWKSSDTRIATVDGNGLVTLTDNPDIVGKEVTITATCNGFTASSTLTVAGQKYDLWVKGIQVNSVNQNDILGDGTASFAGNTLTLNDATINAADAALAIQSTLPELNIELHGNNTLTSQNTIAAVVLDNATISGDGTLTVEVPQSSAAIWVGNCTLTESVTVKARGQAAGIFSIAGTIAVNTPEATLHSWGGTYSLAALNIVGEVVEPEGAIITVTEGEDGSSSVVTDASGTPVASQWVVVKGSEGVDSHLKGDVNEDGKVDISDIVAVINQIAGTATYRYADVNEDTKVDISDIVAIINIIAEQ